MQTNYQNHAETRSISIAAPPAAVIDFLADPHNLPRWAPAFAQAVRMQDGQLLVATGAGGEIALTLSVSRKHGTVDLLAAVQPGRGAFSRVLPNGDGSEYQFTLFFPAGTAETAVSAQMGTVCQELEAVRSLCESGG